MNSDKFTPRLLGIMFFIVAVASLEALFWF